MADSETLCDNIDHDAKTEEVSGKENTKSSDIARQLMKDPQVLASLQGKLQSIVGTKSGYIQSLAPAVRRRVKALKKLQSEIMDIESEFYKEVHALEVKYSQNYAGLFTKRRKVIGGDVEPTDDDCDWPSDEEEENKLPDEVTLKVSIVDKPDGDVNPALDVKGIPYFWLSAFKNVDILSDQIQDYDEPILKHLDDICVVFFENPIPGFKLEFHFSPNDYFTETVLTKEYSMRFEQDPSDLLGYEGPELVKCKGCTISWNKGRNVTVKTVKKKQKHKSRGATRTVMKVVRCDSFFNFFNPPEVPDGGDEDTAINVEEMLATDFEIGHFIRERLVPRAVLFFTGEANDDEDEDDEDDDDDEDEEDDGEENDPDFKPPEGKTPVECNQQ